MMSEQPTSSDFNPLLALYSIDSEPQSDAKVYDNIAVFEANLKRKNENTKAPAKSTGRREKSFSQRKKLATEARNRDLSKLKDFMEARKLIDQTKTGHVVEEKVEQSSQSKDRRVLSNVLLIMEKSTIGPLSLLQRATSDRLRCNVYTRHFNGLRGVLCGFVVAFDRYMNLAMTDVDETFCLSPRGKVIEHQKKLTISQLENVSREVRLHGLKESSSSQGSRTSSFRHLPTTGVMRVKTKTKTGSDVTKDRDVKVESVKRYDTKNPPGLKEQVFHGGGPQLFHRHINNIYVRGNNVVIVALAS